MDIFNILFAASRAFSSGINSLNWYWKIWICLMILLNGILPLLFLPKITSIIVLSASLSGFVIGLVLTHAIGYSPILGLMHFPWIPMVCFLVYRALEPDFALDSFHNYWLISSLVISTISLIIDFSDVYKFITSN